jgi:predicted Zn-dependent peptidase
VDAVTLDIWTNVGSVDESDDINGMAHPEFQRERLVVLEEIRRSDDNPDRRLYKHTSEMAYQYLPYRRPVLGLSEVIEHLTSDQMRAFHRQWYRPENITVAVVGNISVARAIAFGNRL